MKANQNIVVENYLALAKSIALKFIKNQDLRDSDIYGCACLALVDASKNYDPSKGAFTTWATRKIKHSIISYLRKNKKYKNTENLGELTEEIRDNSKNHANTVGVLAILLNEDQEDSDNYCQNKKILLDHFIQNKSWAQIGRDLNLSRERARQKGQEAIKLIQNKHKLVIGDLEPFFGE